MHERDITGAPLLLGLVLALSAAITRGETESIAGGRGSESTSVYRKTSMDGERPLVHPEPPRGLLAGSKAEHELKRIRNPMNQWKSDAELFELCRTRLYSAVIGDVLDLRGRTRQFLPPEIQPIEQGMVVAGRAMPVLVADDAGGEGAGRANESLAQPFGLMLRALDDLRRDEVYLCTGSSPDYALWGELMSTAARNRGAAGAVLDGYSRDTRGILKLGFPTFSHGRYAQDQRPRGKVIDFRCTVSVRGVDVRPGDIVFGDMDGVLVVPREIEEEVIEGALEKAEGERTVFEAIKGGMGAQEAWDRYGIL